MRTGPQPSRRIAVLGAPARAKAAAKAPAKKAGPARTFAPGQCHHKGADGTPDCKRRVEAKGANLCGTKAKPGHQQEWAAAARARREAAHPAPAKAPKTAKVAAKPQGTNVVPLRTRKPAPAPERIARRRVVAPANSIAAFVAPQATVTATE